MTTSPNMAMNRRYESYAKRGLPVPLASPSTVASFRPRLSTVSIMPGMENTAPERIGEEQGIPGIAKPLAGELFQTAQVLFDLLAQPVRIATRTRIVDTGLRGHDEPGWHWDPDSGHLGEIGSLAAQ